MEFNIFIKYRSFIVTINFSPKCFICREIKFGFGDYKYEDITSYYVVSRAFKKLEEIIRISREIIKVNHKLIILKGRNAENEINKLKPYENFIYKTENSITDSDSKILVIEIKK